ncbi:Similar to ABC transporter C family member 12; acc. no. Q54U44 [Pyronema omphalodes CBS 100304]|uniref:Similar to ABC transporter C family member 12 acc. no. Q54U44 n=1 Tax=Pyronema omphalodes (strain CBS 100304) TaxID=1076935 RepID=U4LCM2_PYROM|nr:Similar to ABC transporter C family member 12; acc. no. Q54U44 [Pyronema omphalodes CBS 100304]
MGDLMRTGYLRPLEPTDIPLVAPRRSTTIITTKLQESFNRRRQRGDKYPLAFALNEVFFREFWFAGICRIIGDVLQVINPYLLKFLIRFAVDSYNAQHDPTKLAQGPKIGKGVGLAVGIACIQMIVSLTSSQFIYHSMVCGGQARAGLIGMIFDKSLKISGRAKAGGDAAAAAAFALATSEKQKKKKKKKDNDDSGWSNGRVTNLMGTDTYRVDQAAGWFHIIWAAPIQIIIALVLLIINLSYSALAGFALLVVGFPILSWVVKVLARKRRAMNMITDKRVALTQEILTGVRFVKYFGWEESFLKRLQELRNREVSAVQFLLGVRSGVTAVGISLPVFASMIAFIVYSVTDNTLDPASVFSSLALFNSLRLPLNLLPMVIAQTIDAHVSLQRLQEYFFAEEIADRVIRETDMENAIEVSNGSFTWEQTSPEGEKEKIKGSKKERKAAAAAAALSATNTSPTTPGEPFHIDEINLSVSRHELLAVVGSVGSGKTSLLAALAGDMRKTAGSIHMSSNLAYCPQYAWIQNATVRENIIFGKPYDPEWYAAVVEACALKPDLEMLPDGDMTEIGERGITVSGGQKQRLNIARAIYFNAEIVLMDDPLSAVDAHVGRHLFDKAICGLLRDKCRVLATHQLHVLEKVDRVVWMEEGRIQAVGTFPELMANNEGFQQMMSQITTDKVEEEKEEVEQEIDEKIEEEEKKPKAKTQGKALMQAEEKAVASVSWKVYEAYIKASGTILILPILILMLAVGQVGNIWTTLWLGYWTSRKYGLSNSTYIGVFAGLGVFQALFMFTFALTLTLAGTHSSRVLMHKAMKSTLRAPMSFFDTTPLGRIVNRFSKDVDVMDNQLTDAIRMYFMTLAIISSVFILIIVYFYYFVVALVPLAFLFIFSASYYRASAREVKRHEAVFRSHVFAKFGESLTGVASIRAYGLESRFTGVIHKAIDEMNGAYFITFANQRWLSTRLDVIGNLLVFTTAILVVTSRFSVHPSIAGVVLSYILQIVMMLQWMIRQLAEVENAMNATERIHYYGTSLPEEAPLHTNADAQIPPTWPEKGGIEFKDACMRYREGLPLVLKQLNLSIPGGSRVGIVGRTGAGKSSITASLFRLVELSSGGIEIDGVDISTLGLANLRSKLAIIPQDPTLFKGTIRSNLDPFQQYSDGDLQEALKGSYLDTAVNLDSTVEEEGYNFSLGQRQQIALARALVRNARVVVADEATSSVDVETDRLIQKSMKEGFRGRTLVCIAHRLRTVMDYDLVVVMEQGQVLEMGEPGELWRRKGAWYGMCERSGIAERDFEKSDE